MFRDTGSAWVQVLFGAGTAGSVNLSGGAVPSATAGPQSGGSPPAPVVVAGSNNARGTITFGTGTAPAAGNQVNVTFATAYAALAVIMITPINNSLVDLQPTPGNIAGSGFALFTKVAPAASQGNGVYQFSYVALV